MTVFIHASGIALEEDCRAFVQRRLADAVEHLERRINRINVFFADTNGWKGGVDKTCRVVIHLRRQSALVIEDRDHDLLALVGRATERVAQAVHRRLSKSRSRRTNIRHSDG